MVGRSHNCIPAQTKCRCAHYSVLNKGFRGVCHSPYIAQRICANTMSSELPDAPRNVPRPCPDLDAQILQLYFHLYLNRVCSSDRDRAGGLSHIVTFFRDTWNWPMPSEHFRTIILLNADTSFHSLLALLHSIE